MRFLTFGMLIDILLDNIICHVATRGTEISTTPKIPASSLHSAVEIPAVFDAMTDLWFSLQTRSPVYAEESLNSRTRFLISWFITR